MKTKINGIKVFSKFGISQLEEQFNNYSERRKMHISIVKRDISFNDPNIPGLQISICYNNEYIDRHGLEQVKIFNNFVDGTSSSENIEKDVQNFISSKKEVIDVLFLNHTNKHQKIRVIAVFYLGYKEN